MLRSLLSCRRNIASRLPLVQQHRLSRLRHLSSASPSRPFLSTTRTLGLRAASTISTTMPLFGNKQSSLGNFDLVREVKLDYTDLTISKWRSRTTGLSVVHLDYEAPIVNGYFAIGTEIFDDSGCPHTLEHLVFMGSEKYPYKGIIDHFANRGFSNGTNAWTDTDHTAYTVSTAGEQGFLQLLPIYVDHILYPTMTKAGFVTEVHHINPEGEDSGVVYSEMQGRENTSGDLMSLRSQRLLNPPGSAYRSETGGLMEALRVLSVEQIRKYHASYYVPHNLTLVVAGKLSSGTASLLNVLQEKVEPTLIAHGQNKGPRPEGWKRPFLETPSADRKPIPETIKKVVEFPEQDESQGELVITFLGPPPTAFLERKALDILGTYMTSSPVAPLNKEYVETENPLCSYIYFHEDTRATRVDMPIYIGSVPTEHLDTFNVKLKASFKRIATEGLDMDRMKMVIDREIRQLRSKMESDKGEAFATSIINDFLYGKEDGSELHSLNDEIQQYLDLQSWLSKQWTDLLQKYFIDPHSVVVIGKPSSTLAETLEKDEKVRIAAQVKALGPEGLAKAAKELEEAKQEHDKPIPTEVLESFPVPDVKSISWIKVESAQEQGKGRAVAFTGAGSSAVLKKHIDADGHELPFFVEYDHVQSDFVTVRALFSLAGLPDRLRLHIMTFLAAFFALPVKRANGQVLTHEEVINALDNETVEYEANLGISGIYQELLHISIKVETSRYEEAVAWLSDVVYRSQFDKERLGVAIAKVMQSLPEYKRDGSQVLNSVWLDLLFNHSSMARAGSVLPLIEFMPKLAEQLQEQPEQVIADFEDIRSAFTKPEGIRIAVTGNVLALEKPRSVWAKHFGFIGESALTPVPVSANTLNQLGKAPAQKAVVVSLPTIESAFVQHSSQGIRGMDHPDYPAIRVTLEVLNATESYLWRYIRGSGLAYGANVSLDAEAGLLSFHLYRSSNSVQAFHEASKVVKGLVDESIAFESTTLDAAKSSIVYSVTKGVSTPGRAALMSFINQGLKGVSQNYSIDLLERYQAITKEDVLATLQKYFLPLFDPRSSVAVVVTSPAKVDGVADALTADGFQVEKRTLEISEDEMDGSDSESESESDR